MSYHINLQGEVHPCTAKTQCRFGDFDRDHYTTVAQARAAYEMAQAGKSMVAFTKKDSFFAVRDKAQKEADKEQRRLQAFVQSLKPLDTLIPPKPDPGYWLELTRKVKLKHGTVLSDGSTVVKVEAKQGIGRTVTTNFGVFTVTQADLSEGKLWIEDRANPEALEVRKDFFRELTLEDGYKNFTKAPFLHMVDNPESRDFAKTRKRYKDIVKRNLKAGIHMPYTRAYVEMFGKNVAQMNTKGEAAFRWVMNGGRERFPEGTIRNPLLDLRGWNSPEILATIVKDSTSLDYTPGLDISWKELAELRRGQ